MVCTVLRSEILNGILVSADTAAKREDACRRSNRVLRSRTQHVRRMRAMARNESPRCTASAAEDVRDDPGQDGQGPKGPCPSCPGCHTATESVIVAEGEMRQE